MTITTTTSATITGHLEQQANTTTSHSSSRKSQRVYRSPSDPSDLSPFTKQQEEKKYLMEIDEKDQEAGTILMALAQHASRINRGRQSIYHQDEDEKPTRSNSMSIRNLLDPETDASIMPPHVSPYHSLSSESKPLFAGNYEARRKQKGFQICIQPRRNSLSSMMENTDDRYEQRSSSSTSAPKCSFRPPSTIRMPPLQQHKPLIKYKRNTTHIHISYQIHAHRQSLRSSTSMYENSRPYETNNHSSSSYPPSAFRTPSQLYSNNKKTVAVDWNRHHATTTSLPSSYH